MSYAVMVVWRDGRQDYLNSEPSGERLEFRRRWDAEEARDFVELGLVPDEAQSVSVVQLPGPGQQATSVLGGGG